MRFVLTLALVALLAVFAPAASAQERPNIEAAQRALQERYQKFLQTAQANGEDIGGNPPAALTFPSRLDGTPAGAYPTDKFYDADLIDPKSGGINRAVAIDLIRNLRDNLSAWIAFDHFVAPAKLTKINSLNYPSNSAYLPSSYQVAPPTFTNQSYTADFELAVDKINELRYPFFGLRTASATGDVAVGPKRNNGHDEFACTCADHKAAILDAWNAFVDAYPDGIIGRAEYVKRTEGTARVDCSNSTTYWEGQLLTVAGTHVFAGAAYEKGTARVYQRQADYAKLLWNVSTNTSLTGTSAPHTDFGVWHDSATITITTAPYVGPVMGDTPATGMTVDCPSAAGTNYFGWTIHKMIVLEPTYTNNISDYYTHCSGCSACVLGKTSVKLGSLEVEIGLGRDANRSVGTLALREPYITSNTAHPMALSWNLESGASILRASDPDKTPRQIKTQQGLVDIVVTDQFHSYEMRFYDAASTGTVASGTGLYQPTGSPYKTVTVQNPDTPVKSVGGVTNATPFPNSFLIAPASPFPSNSLYYARITSSTGNLPVAHYSGQLKASKTYVVYSHPNYPNTLILAYEPNPGSGQYSLDYFESADTSAVLTVSTPQPYDRIKITESGGAYLKSSTYQYDYIDATHTASWSLAQSVDNALLRTDRRDEVDSYTTGGAYQLTATDWVQDAQQVVVSKKTTVRQVYPWNDFSSNWTALQGEPTSVTIDPSGAALTTTYDYYANSTTDGDNYGHLKEKVTPDGGWERYEYDSAGRVKRVYRSYKGSAPAFSYSGNEVVDTTYGQAVTLPDSLAGVMQTEVTSLDSAEVSRTYTITAVDSVNSLRRDITIQAKNTGAAWDATGNLWTQSWTIIGGTFDGRVARELRPDGIATIYQYTRDAATGHEITTVFTGVPDTGLTAITRGAKVVTETNEKGGLVSRDTYDIATATTLTGSELGMDFDAFGRPWEIQYLDGTSQNYTYGCCGLENNTDREGILTTYTRDYAERVLTATRAGVTTENVYDILGRLRLVKRYPAGQSSSAITVSQTDYDVAGRRTSSRDHARETTYVETPQPSQRRTSLLTKLPFDGAWPTSDRGEITDITWADGRMASRTGNAAAPVSYGYGTGTLSEAASLGYASGTLFRVITETKLDVAGAATAETITRYIDPLGRTVKTAYADGAAAYVSYNDLGQVFRQTDPDGVQTLFSYDTLGEPSLSVLDMNQDGVIDYAGTDRITRTTLEVGTRTDGGSFTVQRITTEGWDTTNTDTPRTLDITERSVDGLRVWQTRNGQTTRIVTAYSPTTASRIETTTLPDSTSLVRTYVNGRLSTETRRDNAQAVVTSLTYGYDAHGRVETVTDSLGHVTTYSYYTDDQIHTVLTPDPDTSRTGSGYDAQTTTFHYDAAGRVDLVTQPDGAETHTSYWPIGKVKRTWGGRSYPQAFTYDAQGRMKTLTTWQDYTGQTGAAVTTWNYDPQRGWLNNKRYSDDKGPGYEYWPSGRLKTRTWQRGVVTTYGYDNAGEVSSITYSDSTTPAVSQTYDRLGRPETTTDAAGLLTRSYDPVSLNLAGETYSGSGLLSGRSLTRGYDSHNRPQSLSADTGYAVGYGYDSAGRLDTISQGFHAAKYAFKTGVGTVETATVKRSGVERVKHTRTTDNLGRVAQVKSSSGGSVVVQRDYTYNDANQRTQIALEDTREWAFGYDAIGQVTSALKRLADHSTPLPGYSFGYTFDDIGNRTQTVTNARTTTWSPDLLNRYTSRQVSGAVDVRGEAHADATVTVNTQATTRTGKDFYREVAVSNGSAAVNTALTIEAVTAGSTPETITENRTAFSAQTPESYSHDDDGNLTADGRWIYTWDGENRLVAMETVSAVATALPTLKQRLEFSYDAQGRRISKVVKLWDVSAGIWTTSAIQGFLYDGWNLITEIDVLNNSIIRTHVWGVDLSGTTHGAGGVGGLILTNTGGNTFAASSDANGNVVAYINTATLAVSGRADYGAFGEAVMRTGVANTLPFGFSSKYADRETGVSYYGYRYYSPGTGRWLSRDPMGEWGGVNLHGIVSNSPIDRWDYLGLEDCIPYDPRAWTGNLLSSKNQLIIPSQIRPFLERSTITGAAYGMLATQDSGFIDVGHVRENMDKTLHYYIALSKAANSTGVVPAGTSLPGSPGMILDYDNRITSADIAKADFASAASRLAQDESYEYEEHDPVPDSKFSPEDIPSNHIGAEIAKRFLANKKPGDCICAKEWAEAMDKGLMEYLEKARVLKKRDDVYAMHDNFMKKYWDSAHGYWKLNALNHGIEPLQ